MSANAFNNRNSKSPFWSRLTVLSIAQVPDASLRIRALRFLLPFQRTPERLSDSLNFVLRKLFLRVIAILITFLFLVTQVHGPVYADDDQNKDAMAEIQTLLYSREVAVKEHNRQAFFASLFNQASPEFRARQTKLFEGLVSVPFAHYRLEADARTSGDMAKGLRLAARYGADEAILVETRETYRFAGYDDRDAQNIVWLTYIRHDTTWSIANDTDAAVFGLNNTRTIWDNGPVLALQLDHFLVIAPPDKLSRAHEIGELAERAFSIFERRWTIPWSKKVPLLIPADNAQSAALIGSTNDLTKFGALTTYVPSRNNGWFPLANRIVVQDETIRNASDDAVISTLVHELVHAALSEKSGPDTPHWLQEGIAMMVQRDITSQYSPVLTSPMFKGDVKNFRLPSDDDFFASDGNVVHDAYEMSLSAVTFLRSKSHTRDVIAAYEEIGAMRVAPGSPSYHVNVMLEHATGMSTEPFIEEWHRNISRG